MPTEPFDYTIDEKVTWPPHGRPHPPFGPVAIEILRSCPLRSCFEASPNYEPRLGFAVRIGIAFHHVLEHVAEAAPDPSWSPNELAEHVRLRFQQELRAQEAEADKNIRERGLPRDAERIDRALEALVVEVLRGSEEGRLAQKAQSGAYFLGKFSDRMPGEADTVADQSGAIAIETEIPVQSRNGLFSGRVDEAEHRNTGVRLIDYKSALRVDLPGRYERQLQLYAYMWHDTRGQWPVEGLVVYPLTGTVHTVSVDPDICTQVANEAAELIEDLNKRTSPWDLATPGDTCQICQFRPWCKPFWRWQQNEDSQSEALERARLGFEGRIEKLEQADLYWILHVSWRNAQVQVIAPQERFAHLRRAHPDMMIRVLDSQLRGLRHAPKALITDFTELFLITQS